MLLHVHSDRKQKKKSSPFLETRIELSLAASLSRCRRAGMYLQNAFRSPDCTMGTVREGLVKNRVPMAYPVSLRGVHYHKNIRILGHPYQT